jgi:TetR/AcrR family transcriptional regulator
MKLSTRDRIRASALALFAEKGYAATPTREICKRAGITKPVLYYHFKNKEHLYRGLVVEACSEMLRELTSASQRGGNAREKLINVIAADFSLTRRNPELSAVIFRMLFAPQKGDPAFDYVRFGLDWVSLLSGIVEEGVRRRELDCRPRDLAVALLGVDMVYSISHTVRGAPKLDRRLARRVVQLLVDGCRRDVTDR